MRIFDFLFYFTTKRYADVTFRTPVEQASYVLGLFTGLYIMTVLKLIEHYMYHALGSALIPVWIYIIIGIAIEQLFELIYIKNNRYETIAQQQFTKLQFNVSEKSGKRISLLYCICSVVVITVVAFMMHGF
jgi:low affinity Fe/Cu permease